MGLPDEQVQLPGQLGAKHNARATIDDRLSILRERERERMDGH